MKRAFSSDLQPGMILAKALLKGELTLLDAGITLTPDYIQKIRDWGIDSVYIADTRKVESSQEFALFKTPPVRHTIISSNEELFHFKESDLPSVWQDYTPKLAPAVIPMLDPETEYFSSLKKVEDIFQKFRSGQKVPVEEVESLAVRTLALLKKNTLRLFNLISYTSDNHLFSHSLNVCCLSLIIGQRAGFSDEQLILLGSGALLHDIGMIMLDKPFWEKPGSLTEMERLDIRKHTIFGIDALSRYTSFSGEIAYIAYHHHERRNGSGYPKGIRGNLLSKFTSIVSICDVFDAMTTLRSYHPKSDYTTAVFTLKSGGELEFDQHYVSILEKFLESHNLIRPFDCMKKNTSARILVVDNGSKNSDSSMVCSMLRRHGFHPVSVSPAGISSLENDASIIISITDGTEPPEYLKKGKPGMHLIMMSRVLRASSDYYHEGKTVRLMPFDLVSLLNRTSLLVNCIS